MFSCLMFKYFEVKKALSAVACCYYVKKNRLYGPVCLFSNSSQRKCGNKKVSQEAIAEQSLMFLPHSDVICDLLPNRRTRKWNLFDKQIEWRISVCPSQRFRSVMKTIYIKLDKIIPHMRNFYALQLTQVAPSPTLIPLLCSM